jgi:hypothetical protein
MGQITSSNEALLQSIPSANGLKTSLIILRESLAMLILRIKPWTMRVRDEVEKMSNA